MWPSSCSIVPLMSWLREAKPSRAAPILRTLLNSWTTTHRVHADQRLRCLWGCDNIDSLTHYAVCPRLYSFVSVVLPSAVRCPLVAGVIHDLDAWTKQIHIMTHIYHNARTACIWPSSPLSEPTDEMQRVAVALASSLLRIF